MMQDTEIRTKEVYQRICFYKKRAEDRFLFCLSVGNMLLIAGIVALQNTMQIKGISSVTDGYSAVMLQTDAGGYVLVGIIAFVTGAVLTMICIRIRKKSELREEFEK